MNLAVTSSLVRISSLEMPKISRSPGSIETSPFLWHLAWLTQTGPSNTDLLSFQVSEAWNVFVRLIWETHPLGASISCAAVLLCNYITLHKTTSEAAAILRHTTEKGRKALGGGAFSQNSKGNKFLGGGSLNLCTHISFLYILKKAKKFNKTTREFSFFRNMILLQHINQPHLRFEEREIVFAFI